MAALENIRKRSGLLLTVIGVAMLAFILGDFMQSKRSGSRGSVYVGQVLGEDLPVQEFEIKVQEGIENWKVQNPNSILNQTTTSQIRNQVWNQYIRDFIMNNEYKDLGIDVSDEEFFELLQGVNVHPEISSVPAFQDPVTKQFDRTRVLQYLKQIDQDATGEAKSRWISFQKYLIGQIKNSKFNTLVEKGVYVTTEEAMVSFNEGVQQITFNYVSVPYKLVDDSLVEPSNKEINSYYRKNLESYKQESSKDIDFVVFSVIPSEIDNDETLRSITNLVEEFKMFEDYELIVRRNSDNTNSRFEYKKSNELQDPAWSVFNDKNKGDVIGPYLFSDGIYRIAKLVDIGYRPDSVEARHILLSPSVEVNIDSAMQLANNLKEKIEQGADFGLLAEKKSDDKGSSIKGGDLGWFTEGMMVDEFNEFCFTGKRGELNIVSTDFGVHLVQITDKSRKSKKMKIAYIDRVVEASSETFSIFYSEAAQFAGKVLNKNVSFDSLVVQENLVKRSDTKVQKDKQNISGLPNSREMIRWALKADEGDVSEVFQFDNSYVVAFLKRSYDDGYIQLDDIREQVKAEVVKNKKSKYLSGKIDESEDLIQIASRMKVTVQSDKTAVLNKMSLAGIGYEPALVGGLFATDIGNKTKIIIGNSGLYVAEVLKKDKYRSDGDFNQEKKQMLNNIKSFSNSAVYNVLNDRADILDNRSDFY